MGLLERIAKQRGLRRAENAKSPSYFSVANEMSFVDDSLVLAIYDECLAKGESLRVCLHSDPEDDLHNMIIAHPRGAKIRAHANMAKSKAYHILRGEMLVGGYDGAGEELFRLRLSEEHTRAFRIPRGVFLVLAPLSEAVVFHEIALGPFVRERDSVWSDFDDEALRENLLKGEL